MWMGSDWLFALLSRKSGYLDDFDYSFINVAIHLCLGGKAALAQSWTPGDLSGKNMLWGKFVAESFDSAELSMISQPCDCCCVTPALSCYGEQTQNI